MLWVIIAISAYFLFSITALGDRFLLIGPPNPKIYSFYVGILGIIALVLIPFVGFSIPNLSQIILALLAGAVSIFANFIYFTAIEKFEASRVLPAIGGILPMLTFLLIFPDIKEGLTFIDIAAFIFLVMGSILISVEKGKGFSFGVFPISVAAALFFALTFIFSKYIYESNQFWTGFIWMRIGAFLAAFCLIFTKEVKEEIFKRKPTFDRKTGIIFLVNQTMGAGAFTLQSWAIKLTPFTFLPFINALEGTKYVFLLIFSILLSNKLPQILREEFSKKILIQKILATLLIVAGLMIFFVLK